MADGDREVLSSLPRTRPERRSTKRGTRSEPGAAAAPKAVKPKAAPRPKAKPAARARAAPKVAPPPPVPRAGYAVPKTASPVGSGGSELVGSAIQALGELAGFGLSLGNRALRETLERLPKP